MSTFGIPSRLQWQGLRGHHIAICALIHFYVHDAPLNEPSPMLSRLLAYTARLSFQVDKPSASLSHFLVLLSAILCDDLGDLRSSSSKWTQSIETLIVSCNTFSGLHAFFTKVERLLMTEELYDEIQGITIKPAERQIDEQSPFGHFLQRCLDDYLGLEDGEFARLVRDVQTWISGENGSDYDRDHSVTDSSVTASLQRGDYSLARAELEGFFDRSPDDAMHLSLQDALYRNAVFHHQTKAYEAAKSSLEEALRLSRGANDMACVGACDKLLRLIRYEEGKMNRTAPNQSRFPSHRVLSIDELWQVESDADQGRPLLSTMSDVQRLLQPTKGKECDTETSLSRVANVYRWQSRLWSRVDNPLNAKACQSSCEESTIGLEEEAWQGVHLQLALLDSEDAGCSLEGRFRALFDARSIENMDIIAFEHWQRSAWKLLQEIIHDHKEVQCIEGTMYDISTEQDMYMEDNEATFGKTKLISMHDNLMARLTEARQIRQDSDDCSASIAMAVKVLRQSEEAQLFQIVREATVEVAESLLGLGNISKAKELLEDCMTQILTSSKSLFRGRATWAYAKVLIKLSHDGRGEMTDVLPWLDRARTAFEEGDHLEELSDVLYVQWKLYESLGMLLEMQEAERDLLSAQKQIDTMYDRYQRMRGLFQSLIAQVGAHVMAGG